MTDKKILTAIGLMSGTSIDGIDVSLIKSDGEIILERQFNNYYPYDEKSKKVLKNVINNKFRSLEEIKNAENLVTQKHIDAVNDFIKINKLNRKNIDVIGFSGHTIEHNPEKATTWQIGNGNLLASKTKIDVVADLRTKDIANGGQGAPLVPIYHHSLFKNYAKNPIIILNIGGVSNITYLQDQDENNIVACDICFGNAPMDDLVEKMTGKEFDDGGKIASEGQVNEKLAKIILDQEYFSLKAPKSLDRNHFHELLNREITNNFKQIKLEDSLKTICYVIAKSLEIIIQDLPNKPKEIIICGGGRKNQTIINSIKEVCEIDDVINIDVLDLEETLKGDFIESQAFAFLAIRNLKKLPITFRKTTGVLLETRNAQNEVSLHSSSCGGVFYRA